MRKRRWLVALAGGLVLVLALTVGWALAHARDRHPGYALNLDIPGPADPQPLRAGFAARTITPDVRDTWTDANGDAAYRLADGDTYEDRNGNGRFDAFWLAGFHPKRAANGVHDDLWARAVALSDGRATVVLVVLDLIGFMHDDVIAVRAAVDARTNADYVIVASTHNHEGPDMIGLWGASYLRSGVDPAYRAMVIEQAAAAAVDAVSALRPAVLRFTRVPDAARPLVTDTRRPHVLDPTLRLMHARDAATGETLGVLVAWADHPETAWSRNLLVTSDFPHFLRDGIERGVFDGEQAVRPGLGGVAVYVNGAIGGLMTTNPATAVEDPFSGAAYSEPSFDKVRAQGTRLALLTLDALEGEGVQEVSAGRIRARARTLTVPLANRLMLAGAMLGVLDRGFTGFGQIRTEVAAVRVGPATFLAIPGEIYPEIVIGGIEAPPGQDYATGPVEVPPLRELMPGDYRFLLGLANDELGYIIPRSEWDEQGPPYLYDAAESPYGEMLSPGPDTAPTLHAAARELLQDF